MSGASTKRLLGPRGLLVVWLPIVLIAAAHYSAGPEIHWVHDLARRAFYVPVVMAGTLGGVRWGLVTALATVAVYVPHAFLVHDAMDPATHTEKLLEMVFYVVLGAVSGAVAERSRREQARLTELTERLGRSVEEVRARDALLARTSRLEALGHLTAGLAHEIRNPLHAMRGTAEILLDAVPPARAEHGMGRALLSEIDRLSGVLKRFLDFARPREPSLADVVTADVLERVVELVRAQAGRQGTRVEVTAGPRCTVRADAEQLVQVILGIVINALQALGEGGRILLLTENRVIEGERWCVLCVENDGPPIAEEMLDSVFDPFVTGRPDGTGLGLATAWRIAEDHGGRLDVRNLPEGAGVEFRLWLREVRA